MSNIQQVYDKQQILMDVVARVFARTLPCLCPLLPSVCLHGQHIFTTWMKSLFHCKLFSTSLTTPRNSDLYNHTSLNNLPSCMVQLGIFSLCLNHILAPPCLPCFFIPCFFSYPCSRSIYRLLCQWFDHCMPRKKGEKIKPHKTP